MFIIVGLVCQNVVLYDFSKSYSPDGQPLTLISFNVRSNNRASICHSSPIWVFLRNSVNLRCSRIIVNLLAHFWLFCLNLPLHPELS